MALALFAPTLGHERLVQSLPEGPRQAEDDWDGQPRRYTVDVADDVAPRV